MNEIPAAIKEYLGAYRVCLSDSSCGEPVAWGFPVIRKMPDDVWKQASEYGSVECDNGYPASWFLITKVLTPAEAREKYGEVTELTLGPRGGFKGVTYGRMRFLSRRLNPKV